MSGAHPTLSAWNRDEHDGFYTAKLHDWDLKVSWSPNDGETRGSFQWVATREGEKAKYSHDSHEEMELAMAEAEQFAELDARIRTKAIAAGTAT
jgi:hypothetical protein